MELSIIPECYIDTNLIETLVPPNKGYNHQKGCGTVTKVMREHFASNFAVGIVDKDKQELDYLKEFYLVLAKGNIQLYKHNSRNHFIVRVIPAMERFILFNVDKAGINIQEFGLPVISTSFEKQLRRLIARRMKDSGSFLKPSGIAGSMIWSYFPIV